MKFTGHERDTLGTCSQTDDLDSMHARFYNPTMGRFLSPDPLRGNPAQPLSWNLYSYALGNTVNFTDPRGREVSLGSNEQKAQDVLEELKKIAGDAGKTLYIQKRQQKLFGLITLSTKYYLAAQDREKLKASGVVGRALAEWIGAKATLEIRIKNSDEAMKSGGGRTVASSGNVTIEVDPRVVGANVGGVPATLSSALVHELGHSLVELHPGLRGATLAGDYGFITNYPSDVKGIAWATRAIDGTEPFAIAFENVWRGAGPQRAYWNTPGDYRPPAGGYPDPLW
jgi:RHS repeat-associated protein